MILNSFENTHNFIFQAYHYVHVNASVVCSVLANALADVLANESVGSVSLHFTILLIPLLVKIAGSTWLVCYTATTEGLLIL